MPTNYLTVFERAAALFPSNVASCWKRGLLGSEVILTAPHYSLLYFPAKAPLVYFERLLVAKQV